MINRTSFSPLPLSKMKKQEKEEAMSRKRKKRRRREKSGWRLRGIFASSLGFPLNWELVARRDQSLKPMQRGNIAISSLSPRWKREPKPRVLLCYVFHLLFVKLYLSVSTDHSTLCMKR